MKINLNKKQIALDINKQVTLAEDNCYICTIKVGCTNINATITNNIATIQNDALQCDDIVDVWYYSYLS
jgi:hypothetical protein